MKIDRIEPSKHKKNRFLIFLEDKSCIKITEQELLKFSFHVGDDLNEADLMKLRGAADVSNWKAKAAEMLSRQAMSKRGLERKLKEKGAPESEIESISNWLESIGALDDLSYAKALAARCVEKGYGPARIRAKLYEKGVDKNLWDDILSELPPDAAQIDAYFIRKSRGVKAHDLDEKEKRRLTAGLLRRGFSWEDIKAAWSRFEEETAEE